MTPIAYILRHALTAKQPVLSLSKWPTRWDIHARYALRLPDETVDLPVGTWLLALPETEGNRDHPPHYRLADGRLVCLDAPLSDAQAAPLTDPQALTALSAYRPLAQAAEEDWGLALEHVDHNAPFRLIRCPLCGGTTFTSVDFAGVWCDTCNAQFQVRSTAGDPGFVLDCTWAHYQSQAACYLLPRTADLLLTMVCKSGDGLLDLQHNRYCHREDCTPAQVALTDGREGEGPLRAGLHACALGDVYDWSFYGRVPAIYNHNQHGWHPLVWPGDENSRREEGWPRSAFVPVTGLSGAEQQTLRGAASLLTRHGPAGRYRDELAACLNELAQRPSRPLTVRTRSIWPAYQELAAGEEYLLHRWLLQQEQDGWVTAETVWLVVRDVSQERYSPRWQGVRDNLSPHCGQAVTAAHLTAAVDVERPWATAHGHCRDLWRQHNWQPMLMGS